MRLKSLPKDLFAEILDYLADYEHLNGLDHILEGGEYSLIDVRSAMRETATALRRECETEKDDKSLMKYRSDELLSSRVRELLSTLAPGDERKLLAKFGLLDF